MIDIDKIERLLSAGVSHSRDIAALIAEVRRMRNLLDNRPALNACLTEAYMTWTAQVYESDAAAFSGETKQ